MQQEHPFAQFVRILARGKTKTRDLTQAEAKDAMAMVLAEQVTPEQLGAFLMLQRLKEESAEEIAGFVEAAQASFNLPEDAPQVDLDWSSYAGKKKQLPWFLLAALVLVKSGVKIFMHGTEGHTAGRIYTRDILKQIGFPVETSLEGAAKTIEKSGFAYLPIEHLSPVINHIFELKQIMGLRSPIHTVARMINPFKAPVVLQGIFHPTFMPKHQMAAKLLNQPHLSVFRGEGGEIECRPNKAFEVLTCHNGELSSENWPRLARDSRQEVDEDLDLSRLEGVWSGTIDDDYASAAIKGTLAVALKTMAKADTIDDALKMADDMWQARDKANFRI